ncbi:hypothetical protein MHYP_G00036150 [Metynnis hypsauchen]
MVLQLYVSNTLQSHRRHQRLASKPRPLELRLAGLLLYDWPVIDLQPEKSELFAFQLSLYLKHFEVKAPDPVWEPAENPTTLEVASRGAYFLPSG